MFSGVKSNVLFHHPETKYCLEEFKEFLKNAFPNR